MKKGIVALGIVVALCGFISLDAKKELCCDKVLLCHKGEKPVSCCNPTLIHREDVEQQGGTYVIEEPGAYALAEDIEGHIDIEANDVCLDLKRHTLSTVLGDIITANDQSNIQIKNGTIVSQAGDCINMSDCNGIFLEDLFLIAGSDGVAMFGCFNLCFKNLVFTNKSGGKGIDMFDSYGMVFENLSFENPTGIAIEMDGCRDMKFHELRFFPVNQAIVFDDCSAFCITGVDASKNTTTGNIIDIRNSDEMTLKDIDISHCIVDRVINPSTGNGIVSFDNSQRICMSCCTFNNNECKDTDYYNPLGFIDGCSRVKVEGVEANCNKVTSTDSSDGMDDVTVDEGNDFCFKNCQFNNSNVFLTDQFMRGLSFIEVKDILIECCEVNGTTIETMLSTDPGFSNGAAGLFMFDSSVVTICDTQANHTTHTLNDKPLASSAIVAAKGFFIQEVVRCRIEGCQANGTTIKEVSDPNATNDIAIGFFIQGAEDLFEDLHICKSEALKSFSAGDQAYGFALYGRIEGPVTLSKCIGSCNKAQLLAAGFAAHETENGDVEFLTVEESCANDNKADEGYGFAFEDIDDSIISHSQAEGNTTSGFFLGRLLSTGTVENVDNKFIRNCSKKNGIGFLFETSEEFAVLLTTINTLLVLENTALCNTRCGFERTGDNFANETWIGNAAQGNDPDFCNPPVTIEEKKHGNPSCSDTRCDEEVNLSFCGSRS